MLCQVEQSTIFKRFTPNGSFPMQHWIICTPLYRRRTAPRRGLTFVSHAGEEKTFVKYNTNAIERANVAAFFDDNMKVETSAGNEMECQAAEADQAIVVLSRYFLTQE